MCRGRTQYEVAGGDRGRPDPQPAPDGGEPGLESVAQGAGEGGRPQIGVVQTENLEVRTGYLQWRTLDWDTVRRTVITPTT